MSDIVQYRLACKEKERKERMVKSDPCGGQIVADQIHVCGLPPMTRLKREVPFHVAGIQDSFLDLVAMMAFAAETKERNKGKKGEKKGKKATHTTSFHKHHCTERACT
jgi:hypothetical protein